MIEWSLVSTDAEDRAHVDGCPADHTPAGRVGWQVMLVWAKPGKRRLWKPIGVRAAAFPDALQRQRMTCCPAGVVTCVRAVWPCGRIM